MRKRQLLRLKVTHQIITSISAPEKTKGEQQEEKKQEKKEEETPVPKEEKKVELHEEKPTEKEEKFDEKFSSDEENLSALDKIKRKKQKGKTLSSLEERIYLLL